MTQNAEPTGSFSRSDRTVLYLIPWSGRVSLIASGAEQQGANVLGGINEDISLHDFKYLSICCLSIFRTFRV